MTGPVESDPVPDGTPVIPETEIPANPETGQPVEQDDLPNLDDDADE